MKKTTLILIIVSSAHFLFSQELCYCSEYIQHDSNNGRIEFFIGTRIMPSEECTEFKINPLGKNLSKQRELLNSIYYYYGEKLKYARNGNQIEKASIATFLGDQFGLDVHNRPTKWLRKSMGTVMTQDGLNTVIGQMEKLVNEIKDSYAAHDQKTKEEVIDKLDSITESLLEQEVIAKMNSALKTYIDQKIEELRNDKK